MSGVSFVDTNILVYTLSGDVRKADIAETIVLVERPTISVQVLNETALVLRRKHRMEWPQLDDFIHKMRRLAGDIVPLTVNLHEQGLALARHYKIGVYDAMIVATALLAECDTLYSEDMHDGLVVEGRLMIVNPFRAN